MRFTPKRGEIEPSHLSDSSLLDILKVLDNLIEIDKKAMGINTPSGSGSFEVLTLAMALGNGSGTHF